MSLDLVTRNSPFGRPPKYANAEQLWNEFIAYAKHLQDNPLIEVDFRGKDAVEVALPKMRAMTKSGFAVFAGFCEWREVDNQRQRSDEFSRIVTRIESCIFTQKLEGAAAGFFNSSIIARELGLSDKSESTIKSDEPLVIIRTEPRSGE
jgi:hypothetical protein